MISLCPGLFFQPVKRSISELDLPPPKKNQKKKSNEVIDQMIAHCSLSAHVRFPLLKYGNKTKLDHKGEMNKPKSDAFLHKLNKTTLYLLSALISA